jgi:predicted RNA-binding Zn ribbon-like protein
MISAPKWRVHNSSVGRIRMLGGNPALDLANTVHWRGTKLVDFASDYTSLVAWAVPAQLLTEVEKNTLLKLHERHQPAAKDIHKTWLDLRTALKSWLTEAQGRPHIEPLNQPISEPQIELKTLISTVAKGSNLNDVFGFDKSKANDLLMAIPLLRSAMSIWQLMQFPPAGIIRQCQADACGGFFLDQSRAKPRRWCSMDGCGNREKAARHRLSLQESPPLISTTAAQN